LERKGKEKHREEKEREGERGEGVHYNLVDKMPDTFDVCT